MKKLIKMVFGFSCFCLMLTSCKQVKVYQAQDQDLLIQIAPMKSEAGGAVNYKARVLILQASLFETGKAHSQALLYKNDSSFYLQAGVKKIYPAYTQPVANGIANSFEYLLGFSPEQNLTSDTLHLIYQDRYLNLKTYNVLITQ